MRLIEHTPKRWAEFVRTRNPITESIVPLNARGQRAWSRIGTDAMIAHAKWVISDIGVKKRKELEKADRGLYSVLGKRKLLDKIDLEDSNADYRDWAAMSDEELVNSAKELIAERGVEGRNELKMADSGIYRALRRRKLLDGMDLERKQRDWAAMDDEEFVNHAKEFIGDNEIERREELRAADRGLYLALNRRKLLARAGLVDSRGERRDWAGMNGKELVEFAKWFIAEKRIGGRHELKRVDGGLYKALRKRKLLDRVFANIESLKHVDAVQGVLDALESFGDDP